MDAEEEAISKASLPAPREPPGSEGPSTDASREPGDQPAATATDVALEQDA